MDGRHRALSWVLISVITPKPLSRTGAPRRVADQEAEASCRCSDVLRGTHWQSQNLNPNLSDFLRLNYGV